MLRHSAADIATMLAARIDALCRELIPHGRREGTEWVAASLVGTSQRSFSVRLTGGKAGVWGDFAASLGGDALDLVAHVQFRGDKKKAYAWALGWLGLATGAVPAPVAPIVAPAAQDARERATGAAALRLWLEAQPSLAGTPAASYLASRGIDLAQLGRQPRALRFHPACLCTETDRRLPALLAAICGPDGKQVATHRTWLAEIDGAWRKASLRSPKKTLGSFAGGTIRLWRGASGKPLASASESETVVIGEGIETCLSIALACPEWRVIAAVSLGNLGRIVLPPHVLDIVIAADNDQGNAAAEGSLQRAADRLLAEGRSVRIARSSRGKDFNDCLVAAA